MGVSKTLKLRRKELGYTLLDIAAKMGVSEATVQRWESGNIKNLRYNKIIALADVLEVSPAYLMGWEDNSKNDLEVLSVKDNPFTYSTNSSDKNTDLLRLLEIFNSLDVESQKELLSYAEFKEQAYKDDPDLKDAEEAAAEYIKEVKESEQEADKESENTLDQPEKIG